MRFTLASLLAPNNIPGLDDPHRCRFQICTTPADWNALQDDPMMVELRKFMQPEFLEIAEEKAGAHKYRRMTDGHLALTRKCYRDGACAIYVAPDTIIPDGCIVELQRLFRKGKKVVLCTAIRFDLEGVEAELRRQGVLRSGAPLVLSRRDAVQVGLNNLHAESRAGNYDAGNFGELAPEHNRTNFPTCCYFEVPGEAGVVIHTHNWAPFMIDFSTLDRHDAAALERWAIDGDYNYCNFGATGVDRDIHIVRDSDSIILIGLTPGNEMVPSAKSQPIKTLPVIGDWTKGYMINRVVYDRQTDPLRRAIYPIPVRWHSRDIGPEWEEAEGRARGIMAMYATVDLHPLKLFRRAGSSAERATWRQSGWGLRFLWNSFVLALIVSTIHKSNYLWPLLWSY
ncbi:MAG: hypothetical protein K8F27_10460, partial [Sulfuricellaceae bacterium]|nr:hypothetical protein [Sulfuricellaceae bacterium]